MATSAVTPPPGYKVHPPGIHPEALPPDFDQWDEEPKKSKGPTHPAGKITAWDEETKLPIVRRDKPEESEPAPKAPASPEPKPEVGDKDQESGRTVTQPTDKLGEAQKLATAAAPELKEKLTTALEGIKGAKLDSVRDEKDPERAKAKATKQDQPPETISDLLAARISVDSPEAKEQVVQSIKSAFGTIKDEDQFDKGDKDYGYRAQTLQVEVGDSSAEIQIIPKEVLDVEDQTHENYKAGREAEINGKPEEAEAPKAANKQIHDEAMQKFTARNEGKQGKPLISQDADKGNVKSDPPSKTGQQLNKGQHVLLPDGRSGSVDFHDHKMTGRARVTADDGERIQSIPGKNLTAVTSTKAKEGSKYIAVDLDGTLSKKGPFDKSGAIGAPVPAMVAKVKEMLAQGEDVRILTARVAEDKDGKMTRAIEAWLQKNIGRTLPVSDMKGEHMKALYDDKAVAVQPNTGKVLGGKENEAGSSNSVQQVQKEAAPTATDERKPVQPANRASSADALRSGLSSRTKPKEEEGKLVQVKPPKGHTIVQQHFRKLPS